MLYWGMQWWEKLLIGILLFVATLPYLVIVQGAIFLVSIPLMIVSVVFWLLFALVFLLGYFWTLLMWPAVDFLAELSKQWWFRVLFMIISCVVATLVLSYIF